MPGLSRLLSFNKPRIRLSPLHRAAYHFSSTAKAKIGTDDEEEQERIKIEHEEGEDEESEYDALLRPISAQEARLSKVIPVFQEDDEEYWEYAVNKGHKAPKTIQELRNWDLIMEENQKAAALYKEERNEEEIDELDLLREGHIALALRPDTTIGKPLPPSKQFTFNTTPKHVDDSLTIIRYRYDKYYRPFLEGVVGTSCLFGVLWYLSISQGFVTAEHIAEVVKWKNPNSPKIDLLLAAQDDTFWLWYRSMQCSAFPMFLTICCYAKLKGEFWEFKQVKVEEKKLENQLVATKKGPSHTNLIHQVRKIKQEQKRRKLDPIIDTIDLSATFNFSTVKLSRLEDKYFKWKRGGSLNSDPRQLPATQRYGFFELQTRFDKYGRVIEAWERHRKTGWILPAVFSFFTVPQIMDIITGWGG